MTTGMVQEQNLEKQIEKQMGCMAGFLQLFDRHQILSGKKLYTAKRLPPATGKDISPQQDKSAAASPSVPKPVATPSPDRRKPSPTMELKLPAPPETPPPKSPQPSPIFELKEGTKSSWKLKETGRLSLDSRASYDAAKGSLHRKEIRKDRVILSESLVHDGDEDGDDDKQRPRSSTSVIAKLMGLEPLSQPETEPVKQAELRRSASESRLSRDLFQYRFIDSNNGHIKLPNQSHSNVSNINQVDRAFVHEKSDVRQQQSRALSKSTWRSVFEAAEVFPEAPKKAVAETVAIEKRLKMRGIDEASRDLETLKQILEAWQLKGLLHSKSHRNIVYDRRFTSDESPIIVSRPSRSPIHRRIDNDASPLRSRHLNHGGQSLPSVSARRERNVRSPTRAGSPSDGNARRSNSIVKPRPLTVETQKKVNESKESSRRAISPNRSPKVSPRRIGSDQTAANRSRSPRNGRKPTAEINQKQKITTFIVTEDESSSISESTVSTSSQTDTERLKMEEYKEGRSLLERCDKLLHSIAEMNATDQQQSSPVSVLDSSFYESSASPSPIMKRTIDFKGHSGEVEEQTWSQIMLQTKSDDTSDDCDLVYISEILRASHYLPEDSDIFALLEKQQFLKGKDTSKVSRLQRKLIFDTITEILERNKQLPPWKKAFPWTESITTKPTLQKIWSEFQKIREHNSPADDLVEIICGVLKKDLAGDTVAGWGECPVEHSEVVLEIEQMIFRDLVGETIRDLAAFACQSTVLVAPRRKLVF